MRLRFRPAHRLVAIVVLGALVAWVATGEFSSVGSAQTAEGEAPASAGSTAEPASASATTVGVMTPVFVEHARTIEVPGVTRPDKRVTLVTRATGIIAELNVEEGDPVADGEVVATQEAPEALAQVRTAEALLRQRQSEFDAAERLFKRGNYPELQLESAQAALAAAEAQLKAAEEAVDRLSVRAPFAGFMDSVNAEAGSWATPGTEIGELIALDPIVVASEVSELSVGALAVGAEVGVRLADGTTAEGTIRTIGRAASLQTRTFPVEVVVPNPEGQIRAGMTAALTFRAAPHPAVAVPRSAIVLASSGELSLRVIGADDIARSVPVAILDETEDGLIVEGVPEGVRIIVAGQASVEDGDKVAPVEMAAEARR